ncbi:MAG: MBL fold metallo-hydrolase [Verrucomicrobiales bacterium]|nr:MBL fold metallo-hydrolase [Verrucomicrobiales bacterium]
MLKISRYTGGLLGTNGYFVGGGAGAGVLIDAPKGIAEWAKKEGYLVDALLLTHQHFDHIEDVAAVVREWGCPVYGWSEYDRGLTLEDFFGGFGGMSLELEPFEVGEVIEGKSEVVVGALEFGLIHVPGHSADSVCFQHRASGELFGGDVLMSGSIGRSDFPGGDGELLVRGIKEKILTLEPSVRIWPGHGAETSVGVERVGNPFL